MFTSLITPSPMFYPLVPLYPSHHPSLPYSSEYTCIVTLVIAHVSIMMIPCQFFIAIPRNALHASVLSLNSPLWNRPLRDPDHQNNYGIFPLNRLTMISLSKCTKTIILSRWLGCSSNGVRGKILLWEPWFNCTS